MQQPTSLQGVGDPASLTCPDDASPLVALYHHNVEVDVCISCGGVWLDRGEWEEILRARARGDSSADVQGTAAPAGSVSNAGGGSSFDVTGAVIQIITEALSGF